MIPIGFVAGRVRGYLRAIISNPSGLPDFVSLVLNRDGGGIAQSFTILFRMIHRINVKRDHPE